MRSSLLLLLGGTGCALLAACGSGTNGPSPDKGPVKDQPVATEAAITDGSGSGGEGKKDVGQKQDTGPAVLDGKKDGGGTVGNEGQQQDTGPAVLEGKKDGGGIVFLDGKKDGGGVVADAKKDTPQGFDTMTPDGPKSDQPAAPDGPAADAKKDVGTIFDQLKTEGAKTPDAPKPPDGNFPKNDAGKYLCKAADGTTHVCRCNDGIDNPDSNNKTNGKIDLADPCCKYAWQDKEASSSQCDDCVDNDGDGKIDALDPECTGPLDNDEATYGTGIPGDNMDPCKQDCFFDGNSGSGDDKCEWNFKCDPANPGGYLKKSNGDPLCPYDPNFKNCPPTQQATCLQKCQKITPNGCDCFGCCTITSGSVTKSVYLAPTCSLAVLTDPAKCPPCTPSTSCVNTCGLCEVCVGKPAPDPSCFPKLDGGASTDGIKPDAGSGPFCPGGYQYCGPGGIDPLMCPPGTYCITGCCTPWE